MQFRGILVDGSKERRVIRNTWNGRIHVRLVDRDLRGIDGLGGGDTLARGLAPSLGVHGLAFPQRGKGHAGNIGTAGDHAIHMAANAPSSAEA
jgi:hypothetical protein